MKEFGGNTRTPRETGKSAAGGGAQFVLGGSSALTASGVGLLMLLELGGARIASPLWIWDLGEPARSHDSTGPTFPAASGIVAFSGPAEMARVCPRALCFHDTLKSPFLVHPRRETVEPLAGPGFQSPPPWMQNRHSSAGRASD